MSKRRQENQKDETNEMEDDPLLTALGQLPRELLDDVTASRVLARAELAWMTARQTEAPAPRAGTRSLAVPLALTAWGALYLWGAVVELRRLFPSPGATVGEISAVRPAELLAARHDSAGR